MQAVERPQQRVGVALDGPQRGVDLVRHTGDELSKGGHLLGMQQMKVLLFQLVGALPDGCLHAGVGARQLILGLLAMQELGQNIAHGAQQAGGVIVPIMGVTDGVEAQVAKEVPLDDHGDTAAAARLSFWEWLWLAIFRKPEWLAHGIDDHLVVAQLVDRPCEIADRRGPIPERSPFLGLKLMRPHVGGAHQVAIDHVDVASVYAREATDTHQGIIDAGLHLVVFKVDQVRTDRRDQVLELEPV